MSSFHLKSKIRMHPRLHIHDALLTPTIKKSIMRSIMQRSCSFYWISDGISLSVLKSKKWLTGRGWFWQGRSYSQKRRSTFPGQECRSCRPLLQPPHHYGNRCPLSKAAPEHSVPHGAGSAAGKEQSAWWASVQWYWSGRSHLEREAFQLPSSDSDVTHSSMAYTAVYCQIVLFELLNKDKQLFHLCKSNI